MNVSKKIAQTNAQINHLVFVQGHCFFAWVKLFGVIRFLHPLAMARNQHGRHGTTEIFHTSVLLQTQYHSRKWKHKKIRNNVVLCTISQVRCTISQARLARWMQRFDLLFAKKQNARDAIHQHKLL